MRDTVRHHPSRDALAIMALVALLLAACGTTGTGDRTEVAGAAVSATGLDPVDLLASVPRSATPGWQVDGGGPVPVAVDDLRPDDAERATRYEEAGFEAGARLSLVRGEEDRLAVMVDRFPHAAAARQVGDWHLTATGTTLEEGVSRIGATAEGVMVVEDLLVRVVAVGAEAPDEAAVRDLLAAVRDAVAPRATHAPS